MGRSRSVSVLVCRGCCCGSDAKHPDLDHPGGRARRWFGEILDPEHVGLLAAWIGDGAEAPPPRRPARREFVPQLHEDLSAADRPSSRTDRPDRGAEVPDGAD
jgi:hypothetical protein